MSSSSAAGVLDPLGAPEGSFLDTGVSIVAAVPRSERTAPDVTAIHGAEAVAIIRAGGFIAAIESVASELAEGTVIEQQPVAGAQLQREAVITLRLATPPVDPVQLATDNEAGLYAEQAARAAGPDDTEEWFQALAPSRPSAAATSGKRHRKHRHATPPARELIFDAPPAPSIGSNEPAVPFSRHARSRAGLWLSLTSSVCALAPLLAGWQWRRASALLAGVLLGGLRGARLFASGDRRAQPVQPRALARSTYTHAPAGKPVSAARPVARPRVRPSRNPRGRSRTRNGARARRRNAKPLALVAARPARQADAGARPATTPAPSAGSQFAYLGQ
jgi:hypothetical protein